MTAGSALDAFNQFYGDLCHAAAKVLYDIPDDDPYQHTCDMSRAIANNVLKVLENWIPELALKKWTKEGEET